MTRVVRPLTYESVEAPLVFLAGPIQGARDWQAAAIEIITVAAPDLAVASPRTPPPWHGDFAGQVRWEHHYLDQAAHRGATLFWFPCEAEHDCRRAYAQTSRFELGWTMMRHLCEDARIVVGFERGFPNERYLRLTLEERAPTIRMFDMLDDTCAAAIALARSVA